MSNIKSKSITRNTTCSNLFNSNELEYCCEICRKKVDILTISRKPRTSYFFTLQAKNNLHLLHCTLLVFLKGTSALQAHTYT